MGSEQSDALTYDQCFTGAAPEKGSLGSFSGGPQAWQVPGQQGAIDGEFSTKCV